MRSNFLKAFALFIWVGISTTCLADGVEKFSIQKVQEAGESYQLEAQYPLITWKVLTVDERNAVNQEIKKYWDNLFLKEINEVKANDKVGTKEMRDQGTEIKGEKTITFQIVRLDNDFLSVKFDDYTYEVGGAHGYTKIYGFNYDFKNKRILKLDDLFEKNSGYLKWFDEYVLGDLDRQRKAKYPDYEVGGWVDDGSDPRTKLTDEFGITDHGLVIYFGDYDVTSYSEGRPTVDIPVEKAEKYISSDFAKRIKVK